MHETMFNAKAQANRQTEDFVLFSLKMEASKCSVDSVKQGCWLFVGCLMSQQHARVSQGPICSDKFTCCYTKTEVADQTFYLTQSQYTDTGSTRPSVDPTMLGTWRGCHLSANL